ncbi:MAG TPA: hypothetical protein VMK13_09915 [Streptosporangiaceae bacterium]|nr:hypothetical protein [Streptosporangiaceae bacterium]
MRRKRFRPRAVNRRRSGPRAVVAGLALVVAVIVVAGAAYVAVQLLRPVPAMAVTPSLTRLRALPGVPPRPAWPGQGQAALGVPGIGMLAARGGSQPTPIASVAKIMTAYVILRDHPLPTGGSGPAITVTAADVAIYAHDKSRGQSVVKVAAGEKLSERQALEAMLIPSGNNIGVILAGWDAGSQTAFVARMNAVARELGLHHTRYADVSGFDPATVSTASDQLRLALHALQIPLFGQIVAMPQVTLPVAGLAYNVNSALGHDGIAGVKTGSSPQAGGCLVFSARKTVAGATATIVGVVLGVQPTTAHPSELAGVISASENLLRSVSGDLEHVSVVTSGTVLGRVHSAWTTGPAAVAATGLTATGWPGTPVAVTVSPRPLTQTIRQGQPVAVATVMVGGSVSHVTLDASHAVRPPSVRWRLARL